MNNWKINKTVDLARGIDGVEVWPHALLVTGDKNAHEWNVTVMDNGKAASLDGIIQAYFVRSDGATVTATGSVAGNVATVTLPEACYAYEGDLSAVMQLIQDDASVTLSALLLRVRQITTDVIIDPGTEIPSLDDLLAQIENMKQATKDANAATTNANQAATDAETRVDEAISDAEGRVDTAVQSAETATSKANASSAAADASKAAADTAANAANEAADRANKAASGVGIRKKIVDVLPAKAEMEQDVLYLVRRAEPNAENVYDEYMLINGEVEAIGSTKTDLEDYATKEYVGEQIDAVEIGGVNLLLGTKDFSSDLFENIGGKIENESYLGFKVFHKADAWNTFSYHTNFEAKVGEIYTVSFYAKGTVQSELGLYELAISLNTAETTPFYIGSIPEAKATQWNRYAATFRIKTAGKFEVRVASDTQHNNVGEIYVCGIKLERGNKATDWSPAPEDLDAKIDGIEVGCTNLIIDSKKIRGYANYDGFFSTGQPGYRTDYIPVMGAKSMTISESGIARELIFGSGLYVSINYYDDGHTPIGHRYDTNTTEITGKLDQITLTADVPNNAAYVIFSWHVDNINSLKVKAERGNKATDWSPAPEDVDDIEVGGRNLLRGTNQGIANWQWNLGTGGATLSEENYNGTRCVKFTRDNVESTSFSVILYKFPESYVLETNTDYMLSFWVKSTVDATIRCRISKPSSTSLMTNSDATTPERISAGEWTKCKVALHTIDDFTGIEFSNEFIFLDVPVANVGMSYTFRDLKLERGNKATDWSPAPEDTDPRRAVITYDYGGRNLKEVFGTPKALHDALAVGDYIHIAVGDYWPITLNGTFRDYGSYTVKSGVTYYSNNTLNAQVGTTEATYEGTYVSDTAVSFTLSNNTYYVSTANCLDYFERTCNNVTVKLEVAGINHYWRYGDSGDLTGNKPHIVFVSRDCLPFWMRMRKGNAKWEDADATNPWIGSAMFKTLNDETHGVLPLVAATDVGTYIYAGPNKLGMRALLETKAPDAANATGWAWYDRGKLFLPSVAEVWGHPFWAEMNWEGGLGNQFAIFRDSRRHISKGGGDNAGGANWWAGSSYAGSTTLFAYVDHAGYSTRNDMTGMSAVPVCFIFA